MASLIDLSHTITDQTVTYQGLPQPAICDFWSRDASREFYDDGAEFHIGRIDMVGNTGTYIDCPFHRFPDGMGFHETNLQQLAELPALKVSLDVDNEGLEVGIEHFEQRDVRNKAVLIHTGWSRNWGSENYFHNHPFLSEKAARLLLERGVLLVGIDSYNIDDTRTRSRPVHTHLLQNQVYIVEHLTGLEKLPANGFTFTAVPPKIKGMGSFPVRAFARLL